MVDSLKLEDLDESLTGKIYTQDYSPKQKIDGVQVISIKNYVTEDGDFEEVVRLTEIGKLEQMPGFKLAQINRSKLNPKSLKAWHFHLSQDELWYLIPSHRLLVGLWDLRKDSPTKGITMRMILGGGKSSLLFIPKGVAHGCSNLSSKTAELFYLVSEKFDSKNPDEHRIPWDSKGVDFWNPQRD